MGPCLCGDPYCSSCGSPYAAELEAAEEAAMKRFDDAELTPDEYQLAVTVGLAAVEAGRTLVKNARQTWDADRAEAEFYASQTDELHLI